MFEKTKSETRSKRKIMSKTETKQNKTQTKKNPSIEFIMELHGHGLMPQKKSTELKKNLDDTVVPQVK